MRRGTWKSTNFFNKCTRCKKDVKVGNQYIAREWSVTGLPEGFWHKKCFELMNREREKAKKEAEKKAAKAREEQFLLSQSYKNKYETGYFETNKERAEREKREKAEEEANFAETGYMEFDGEREQRERKEKRQQQKPISMKDMSTISLPCSLCGTVSCKSKNSCMVTSD